MTLKLLVWCSLQRKPSGQVLRWKLRLSRRLVGVLHKDDKAQAVQLMRRLPDLHELWLALDVQVVILHQASPQSDESCEESL